MTDWIASLMMATEPVSSPAAAFIAISAVLDAIERIAAPDFDRPEASVLMCRTDGF